MTTTTTLPSVRRSSHTRHRASDDRTPGTFSKTFESAELQLGRSDYLLGEPQSRNPFPAQGDDAKEWTRGWLREHQITTDVQATITALPWKRKKRGDQNARKGSSLSAKR